MPLSLSGEYRGVRSLMGVCTLTLMMSGALSAKPVEGAAIGFGIMSASNSDEYRADDSRCGSTSWAATTLSWDEQLVKTRGLDFGAWGTWDPNPRRTGFEFNWARSGANVSSMIAAGQHTGLAAQVAAGRVHYAILSIGANDVDAATAVFAGTYKGTWTQAQIDAKRNQMMAGITLAADTVLRAGVSGMVISDVGNWMGLYEAQLKYPDPAGRQRFADFLAALNADIASLAASRGIALGTYATLEAYVLSRLDANGDLVIDGEVISLRTRGCDPHSSQINDQTGHMGTVLEALEGNLSYVGPLNARYGLGIVPLSDQEILVNAGIRQGPPGPDVVAPTVSINAPAANATLSGSPITLSALASDNVGVTSVRFQLDGVNLGASVTSPPYVTTWDTRTTTDGPHTLRAVARDAAGNTGVAPSIEVTVTNALPSDGVPPTVILSAPAAGATVSGTATVVSAAAQDNVGVRGVQFRRDGVALGAEDTTAPYSVSWNTTAVADGNHVLEAVARDAAGNVTTSARVTVVVANGTPPRVVRAAPYKYVKEKGTVRAGTVANVATDDNAYLIVRSNTGGAVRTTRMDFDFRALPALATLKSATVEVSVKDSAGPATMTISMWNYTLAAWESLDTVSVAGTSSGTSEVLRSVPLGASTLGRYLSAGGLARVQVVVNRWGSTTHDVSHDLVGLTLTQ